MSYKSDTAVTLLKQAHSILMKRIGQPQLFKEFFMIWIFWVNLNTSIVHAEIQMSQGIQEWTKQYLWKIAFEKFEVI